MPTRRELLRGLVIGGLGVSVPAVVTATPRPDDQLAWPRTPLDQLNVRLNQFYPSGVDGGGHRVVVWGSGPSYQLFFSGFLPAKDRGDYVGHWIAYSEQPPPARSRYFYAMCPFEVGCADEYRPGAYFHMPQRGADLFQMQQVNPDGYFAGVCALVDRSLKELRTLLETRKA